MQNQRIQITKRDVEILKFINNCGFCEMPQLEKKFSLKKPRSYQILQRLVTAKLLQHQRVFHGKHGIFKLNRRGALHTNLPPIDKIILSNYEHTITLTKLYIRLQELYPEAKLISERQLLKERFTDGVGKRGHISDGMLVFPDGKQIVLEVELTLKNRKRTERIFKSYSARFDINEVWYYCPPGMLSSLRAIAEKMPFIKIHNLQEFINE